MPTPEHILGSSEFDDDLQRALEEKHGPIEEGNSADPSLPPPVSATLEQIVEATKDVPRRPRAMLGHYYGYQVAAIAALLAAEHPGLFAGPDILGPIDVDVYRKAAKPPIVLDSIREPDPPPLEKRPGHRSGYKVASEAHHVNRGGKPAGSKLARKAARGKL